MEKRIELEKRGRPAEEILDLNLDNCRATQIEGLTDGFKNLESLSLINVGLTTLKGFPNLPNLRKLELSDNRISGSLNLLNGCAKIMYLNLSGNKIKDIETLEPLAKDFAELRNLDLFNCEVTSLENYREKVFDLLTCLQYLDGYDRNNMEADDEDEDGDDLDGEVDDDDDDDDDEDVDDDDDDDDGDDVVDVGDDDDDDDLDDDDDDLDDDDDEEEVGLSYLQKDDLEGEEDGEDFEPGEGADDDDDDIPDGEEDGEANDEEARGVKRKLPEGEDGKPDDA